MNFALKDYRLLKRIGPDMTGHWQTFAVWVLLEALGKGGLDAC